MEAKFKEASKLIKGSSKALVFTGAGISVESGIPPFRGEEGLWSKYDPRVVDLTYFRRKPEYCWKQLKEIFISEFQAPQPNAAHLALANLEEKNLISGVITQNIDDLHEQAGSKEVYHLHGKMGKLICLNCSSKYELEEISLTDLPPVCKKCKGVLKPDVVFFNEQLPEGAYRQSIKEVEESELLILIGTTGEVAPANMIPEQAKSKGTKIIEINPKSSHYTFKFTDIFLKTKATTAMEELETRLC